MEPVLVTGASGNVGRHVVTVLQDLGVPVRAAVRPSGDPHPASDVETVHFDFRSAATWSAAFEGVRTMFLVRPPALNRVRRDLLPAVDAGRRQGVEHVVFLSVQGAEKNRLVPHAKVESWLRSSGLGWTFVRPSFFTQNLSTTHVSDVRDRDQLYVPAGTGRTAFVDVLDVGAVVATALAEPSVHDRRAWTVTGPAALTYDEVAQLLSEVLGRRITYVRPGVPAYLRHAHGVLRMPLSMAAVTAAIYTTARIGMADGLTDHVRQVLGRAPTSVAATLGRERVAWIAGGR